MESALRPTSSFSVVVLLLLCTFLCGVTVVKAQNVEARPYAVMLRADVAKNPPTITISWTDADSGVTGYTITKKNGPAWSVVDGGSLEGTATQFVDTDVEVGVQYEYRVTAARTGFTATSYISSGIEVGAVLHRGSMLLLVESLFHSNESAMVDLLIQDLVGDGWYVSLEIVSRTAPVTEVKSLIQGYYNSQNISTVFLLGRIPVPYSGNINPDGHGDHQGAWPADVYYADLDGSWTDTNINNAANGVRIQNVPGDGKFDQSSSPSPPELMIGRVDMDNMPTFGAENELLVRYILKDHHYRHVHPNYTFEYQGVIDDNFGAFSGEAFCANGWRNFPTSVGAENVRAADFITSGSAETFMWGAGCGPGGYTSCGGVGNSGNINAGNPKIAFTMFLGSYFGDWDNGNNFLRAPIASEYTLTSSWAGRPNWFSHKMSLGGTIGAVAKQTQTSGTYTPTGFSGAGVHVALMGDPTLRLFPVIPPSNVEAVENNGRIVITWTASPDTVVGYRVFRSEQAGGPFTTITTDPMATNSYEDVEAIVGTNHYMVRAIKLQATPSGSFYNPSQGIFVTAQFSGAVATSSGSDSSSTFSESSVDAVSPSSLLSVTLSLLLVAVVLPFLPL